MISKQDLTRLAGALGGLPVYGCLPGSPAAQAGARYGDVLLAVDGIETPSWEAYISARKHSGDSIVLRLFRDGREFDVELVLDRGGPRTIVDAMAAVMSVFGPLTPAELTN